MVTIPGASGYLNASTLANRQGVSAQSSNVLGVAEGATSLLDVGRSSLFDNGIGLSASARALNNQFIKSNADTFNAIFSLGLGSTATIEGLQQQILALRGNLPESSLSREVLGDLEDVGSDTLDDAAAAEAEAAAIQEKLASDTQAVLSSLSSSASVDEEA